MCSEMKKKTPGSQQTSSLDKIIWLLIVAITAACIYANYHFVNIAPSIKIIGWIFWFLVTLSVAALTQAGKRGIIFIQESRTELRKIVWPTRQETVQTTLIVMVMVAITGIVLWGVDSGFMWLVGKLTRVSG